MRASWHCARTHASCLGCSAAPTGQSGCAARWHSRRSRRRRSPRRASAHVREAFPQRMTTTYSDDKAVGRRVRGESGVSRQHQGTAAAEVAFIKSGTSSVAPAKEPVVAAPAAGATRRACVAVADAAAAETATPTKQQQQRQYRHHHHQSLGLVCGVVCCDVVWCAVNPHSHP